MDGSELARAFFTSAVLVGAAMCSASISAVHVTAGHNALRGSGPGQKDAFDNALARAGCPDRRIDRLYVPLVGSPALLISRQHKQLGGKSFSQSPQTSCWGYTLGYNLQGGLPVKRPMARAPRRRLVGTAHLPKRTSDSGWSGAAPPGRHG